MQVLGTASMTSRYQCFVNIPLQGSSDVVFHTLLNILKTHIIQFVDINPKRSNICLEHTPKPQVPAYAENPVMCPLIPGGYVPRILIFVKRMIPT